MPVCSYYAWSAAKKEWKYLGSDFEAQMQCYRLRMMGRCTATVRHTRRRRDDVCA
ncbi:MAG TPA: hypothetical protein VMD97_01870 [Candidatus Aquilonibacter sp.]|nr:hypothetical protein [Candidatus Aquilonibacter sp.]